MTQTILLCFLAGWLFLGISGSLLMIFFHRWVFGGFDGIPWGQCTYAVLHGPWALKVAFEVLANVEHEARQLREARRWFDFLKAHHHEMVSNRFVQMLLTERGLRPLTKEERITRDEVEKALLYAGEMSFKPAVKEKEDADKTVGG